MIKAIQKLKDRKGFTLVELIVVLVILAILAAMLVPALTGYIDKAREENLRSQAAMVLTAAQVTVSEQYGNNNIDTSTLGLKSGVTKSTLVQQINDLAEIPDTTTCSWAFSVKDASAAGASYKTYKVSELCYSDGTNKITYSIDTGWGNTETGTSASVTGTAFLSSSDS